MNKQFKPGDAVIVDAGLGITKNGNIQRIAETVAYVKHYNGSVVGYKYDMIKPVVMAEQAQKPYGVGLTSELSMIQSIMEKKLTPAELKKREEVAQAMERENPGMDMSKKMAIATATAKKVAEDTELHEGSGPKEKQKTPYRDINSPEYRAAADKQKERMAKDKAAEPGKKMLAKKVAEEVVEEAMDHSKMTDTELKKHINTHMKNAVAHNLSPKATAMLNAAQAELKRRKATQVAEDTEQVDEGIHHAKLMDFAKDTVAKMKPGETHYVGRYSYNPGKEDAKETHAKMTASGKVHFYHKNGIKGPMISAKKFDTNEEVEQIDELKQMTLSRYASKARSDINTGLAMAGDKSTSGAKSKDIYDKIRKRSSGLKTANRKMSSGEYSEDMHYCAKHVFSERFGEGLVVEGSHAEPTAEGLIEWYDVDFGGTVRRVMTEKVKVMHAEYHMNHKKKMKEEEEVEEAKSHTVPKTAKEKDLAALAEPKDKITHADVMVGRGVKKEEVEFEEGFENLPGKATHLTKVDVRHPEHGIISGSTTLRHLGGNKYEVRAGRAKGKTVALDDKHVQKLSMEEVELDEAMISYSDFQSKIKAHQKAGNQIKDDKYDKKKASYTVIDQEGTAKKITHTDSGVSQQHLGSVKRDDDESSETKPTEKRGRGRPAGSKSGARN